MYRVIDTIQVGRELLQRCPDLPITGEGVLAILDPDQVRSTFPHATQVRATRPDGTTEVFRAGGVHYGAGGVVGLFLPGTSAAAVPRDTLVDLVG
jgi:hypothetical protein